jgi:hypothetical protein
MCVDSLAGDISFLESNVTVYQRNQSQPLIQYMLETLALNYQRYPYAAPALADYGPNPNTFLE